MLQGLYAAASGMAAQQNQLDAVSNDLANLDTPGYQAEQMGFSDLLYSSGGVSSGSQVATGAGAQATVIGRDQAQGAIQSTGRPLDVAIQGDGYLQVRRPDGTIGLTRDGSLQLDDRGRLTDSAGDPLVPPITVPRDANDSDFTIASDGQVSSGQTKLGRIAVVTVPATSQLLPDGGSTFSATAASGAIRPAGGATLKQGALVGSNVDMASAMADMMNAQQSYDMDSQAVQYQSQMLQIADQLRSGSGG
jgi:flagellar basal-body rod protein FlgG